MSYRVGYGKPPKHTRFKKGQSGNPHGGRIASANFASEARKALATPIPVKLDGKSVKIPAQRAALMTLTKQALAGNLQALKLFLELGRAHNMEEMTKDLAERQSEVEDRILAQFRRNERARALREVEGETPAVRDDRS